MFIEEERMIRDFQKLPWDALQQVSDVADQLATYFARDAQKAETDLVLAKRRRADGSQHY